MDGSNIPFGCMHNLVFYYNRKFLLDLLLSGDHRDIIQWTGNTSKFKFVDRMRVAKLWGQHKNNSAMTYDKMARALRSYYGRGIIEKVIGVQYSYKFVLWIECGRIFFSFVYMRKTINKPIKKLNFKHIIKFHFGILWNFISDFFLFSLHGNYL